MTTYILQVTQNFNCTYQVDADSPEEAYHLLIKESDAFCIDQSPCDITSSFEDTEIEIEERP